MANISEYIAHKYIRTFVRINFSFTNKFGHSFVSNLFVRIYSDIHSEECKNKTNIWIYPNIRTIFKTNTYSGIHSGQICWYEYIRIFIRVNFLNRIYSDIHSCPNFHECHTLVWGIIYGMSGTWGIIWGIWICDGVFLFSFYTNFLHWTDVLSFSQQFSLKMETIIQEK